MIHLKVISNPASLPPVLSVIYVIVTWVLISTITMIVYATVMIIFLVSLGALLTGCQLNL